MNVLIVGDRQTSSLVEKKLFAGLDHVYRWDEVLPSGVIIHAVVVDDNFHLNGNLDRVARLLQNRPTAAIVLTESGQGWPDGLLLAAPDCLSFQWVKPASLRSLLERAVFGIHTERIASEHPEQTVLF